ncbi:MAG: hypothetical protein PHI97_19545 [Desulfobulbus sp.]|nr:hypothetical protein [Desulfobulbus sp.]
MKKQNEEGLLHQLLRGVKEKEVWDALNALDVLNEVEGSLSVASTIEAISEAESKLNNMIGDSPKWFIHQRYLRLKQDIFYRKIELKEENWKTKLREGKQDKQTKLTKKNIFIAMKNLASKEEEDNKLKKYTISGLAGVIHGTIATSGHVTRVMKDHLGAHVAGKKGEKYYLSEIIHMWGDHL